MGIIVKDCVGAEHDCCDFRVELYGKDTYFLEGIYFSNFLEKDFTVLEVFSDPLEALNKRDYYISLLKEKKASEVRRCEFEE